MALRLQMKLGVLAERDRLPDSPDTVLVVEADAPIVAQEIRLHARQLAEAFRAAPAGAPVSEIRVTVRPRGSSSGG